ncbi:ECF transporter S component [Eubacterium aggregans]|uniref:ECF transporter S component n=1 Tax=Eubacterium aggregans TaxID=81409 RepID=UPI003F3134FA
MKNKSTSDLVQLSLFVAIIVLLAVTPFLGYIPLGFTKATIIHIPVIIGSIVLGSKKGAFLGFVFGLTSLLNATFNPTPTSFAFSPFYSFAGVNGNFWSLVICFVPRILVSIVPFYVYRALKSKIGKDSVALTVAGVCGSLTNTVLVLSLIYFCFGQQYAAVSGVDYSALVGVLMGVVGINGIPEAIVAGVLTLAVAKVLLKYQKHVASPA